MNVVIIILPIIRRYDDRSYDYQDETDDYQELNLVNLTAPIQDTRVRRRDRQV